MSAAPPGDEREAASARRRRRRARTGPFRTSGGPPFRRPRPIRRFYWRLVAAFVVLLALAGVGATVLATSPWGGLQALLVGLGVVFLVGMAMRGMARRFARPIERVTEASRRFGAGDLSHRVEVPPAWAPWVQKRRERGESGPLDELLELGVAWNEMADRIERLVRGSSELLANVSHELRSPLARMRVALELVPRTAENEPRLAAIEADLVDLDRLIEDVLTTARLDATGVPPTLGAVPLAPLLDELVARAATAPGGGFTVQLETRRAPKTLLADGALLRRALWNLVDNAKKHGAAPIVLAAERVADELVLSVTDAGPGVPDAERERLFEPFSRGGRARAEVSGYGLGLALARRVAEVHGGLIEAPPVSSGFRVELRLPLGL